MKTAPASLVGRPIDGLSLAERQDHAGRWVAMELYTPETLPLRRIQAEGASAGECVLDLVAHDLDPEKFEYLLIKPPY